MCDSRPSSAVVSVADADFVVFSAVESGFEAVGVSSSAAAGDTARWRRPALRFLFARKRIGAGAGAASVASVSSSGGAMMVLM